MTIQDFWDKFKNKFEIGNDIEYEAWQFGDSPDLLAQLVYNGIKTATCSLYCLYEIEGEKLPCKGEYSIILNSNNEPICIIRTTRVYITPFNKITYQHAYKEGEGDRSYEYWKKVHINFFTKELLNINKKFTEDMNVVCEEFEVVYKNN